ncbi:MAG: hypothetical protein NZ703_10980 [Gemmataceae bacterium]|nr:hypothetical protein [Gemmataceae bacterium]MDW8243226.1 hypothetical protein [Thermogemmata sp.]
MRKLVFVLPSVCILLAAVIAVAEVGEAWRSPVYASEVAFASGDGTTVNQGDASSAALWVETGRRMQDTRIARLPQPKVPTRRR